jgi:hypothetical protein
MVASLGNVAQLGRGFAFHELFDFGGGHAAVDHLSLEFQFLPETKILADLFGDAGDDSGPKNDQHDDDDHVKRDGDREDLVDNLEHEIVLRREQLVASSDTAIISFQG